jgi:glycosyltransferase involved in cell wall biosynthesis
VPLPLVINGTPLGAPYVGVGTYTLRLILGLARAGKTDFRVLVPRELEQVTEMLPEGCRVFVEGRSPTENAVAKNLYWMEKVAAAAARDHATAVFHSPGPFWSRHRPAQRAVTLHDCIYRRFPKYLGRLLVRRWLARATERYAAGGQLVLTDSECSARDLHELAGIPAEKIRVLYPWADPRFNPAFAGTEAPRVREKYRLPARFFLYVGGYDYRKNVEFLLDAYAAAKRKAPLPPLVLAGRIPTRRSPVFCDVAGAMRENGLEGNVVLPGFIDDADLPGLYGACHALIYPSLYEGFGLPPVEAIACGRPALVAENSSLREIIPEARNRFATDDPAKLAELLIAVERAPDEFYCVPDARFTEGYGIEAYLKIMEASFGMLR